MVGCCRTPNNGIQWRHRFSDSLSPILRLKRVVLIWPWLANIFTDHQFKWIIRKLINFMSTCIWLPRSVCQIPCSTELNLFSLGNCTQFSEHLLITLWPNKFRSSIEIETNLWHNLDCFRICFNGDTQFIDLHIYDRKREIQCFTLNEFQFISIVVYGSTRIKMQCGSNPSNYELNRTARALSLKYI